MIVIPAIDILGGKCVRLFQGDYAREMVFSDSPSDVARRWAEAGARWLHVVDLDAAKTGQPPISTRSKRLSAVSPYRSSWAVEFEPWNMRSKSCPLE